MAISDETWHKVYDKCNGRCQYCGADLLSTVFAYRCAEVDHLLPQGDPYRDEISNLVLACRPCNASLSRAHAYELNTIENRREYLKNTNEGFEKARLKHFKNICGFDPVI